MKLIVANTYYQLIMALQMNNTIFYNDEIVLLVSDHSRNADAIAAITQKLKIFSDCRYVETKNEVFNPDLLHKMIDCIQIGLGKHNRFEYSIKEVEKYSFDEIIYFNEGLFIDGHYSILSRNNNNLKVSLYEEGILSYSQTIPKMRRRTAICCLRNILNRKGVEDSLSNFYCIYPSLYHGDLNPVKIPNITYRSKTGEEIEKIFLNDTADLKYSQKYIFFTSVYDFEGGSPVGEYDLVTKVAKLVGKDNLLVKQHPRDSRTIYKDNGFHVDKNSAIPWEAIQLTRDFSDKVFLTINSGSVLAGSTMSENPVRTYYLYKLCDISGNQSCKKNAEDIYELLHNDEMKKILRTVHIAEKLEDIL